MASAAEGFGIGMLIPLLDALMGGQEGAAAANWFVATIRSYGDDLDAQGRLGLLVGTIFALAVLKALVGSAYVGLAVWFNTSIVHALRCALFQRLLDTDYGFFIRCDHGRLLNTLDGETWRTSEALSALSSLAIHACGVVAFGGLLVLISWQMTLAVAVGVLLVGLLLRMPLRWSRRAGEATVGSYGALSERMIEALSGMGVIRLFGREADERERFEQASNRVRVDTLRVNLVTGLTQPLAEVLYMALFVAVLVAWHQSVELGTLLAFLLLLYRLHPHAKGLDQQRVEFASLLPAIREVGRLLETAAAQPVRAGSIRFRGLCEGIAFRDVTFRYCGDGEGPAAVEDLSCNFQPQRMTALVGGSGAGKSTVIALLCRLHEPSTGQIVVDGVPLDDFDLTSWRGRIAVAGQDAELMNASIRDNIAYGRPDADDQAIVDAARQADAYAFITRLPDRFETRVGERGVRLSAGQRQRIGLARALLREPDILILDEATNALDSLSEAAIQRTLARLASRLTVIVIAHRLSTVRLADWTLVLDRGRLVEQGRPEDLLGRGDSLFAQFWRLQAKPLDQSSGAASGLVESGAAQ
jgi:subfamily B ATP-binding cassette protein MsbA